MSARLDLLSEFDFIYQDRFGFRVSGAGWYDAAYEDLDNRNLGSSNHLENGQAALGLSDETDRYFRGPSGEILDAFVFGKFDVGSVPVNVKLGRHTVFWGEAMLNPVHSTELRPVGAGSGQAVRRPGHRSQGTVPAARSHLDAGPGHARTLLRRPVLLRLGTGAHPRVRLLPRLQRPPAARRRILHFRTRGGYRRSTRWASTAWCAARTSIRTSTGDWGLSTRWSPQWLDGTLGAYYRVTADILPQGNATPAVRPNTPAALCSALGLIPLNQTTCYINPSAASVPEILGGTIGRYAAAYADDIKIYGLSLSKNVAGVSIGADLNYRENMPLLSDTVSVLPASLAPLAAVLPPGSLFAPPAEGESGGARGSTWHGVLNGFATFGDTPIWDAANLIVELTWNHWSDVKQGAAVFKGRDSYVVIGPGGTPVTPEDKVTKDYYGLAVNFTPTKYQIFPGADLSLPISWSQGLSGNSAVLLGGNEGAGSYSVGVAIDLQSKYRFDLKYVDFLGGTTTNPANAITSSGGANSLLTDRGFVVFTFKTTL